LTGHRWVSFDLSRNPKVGGRHFDRAIRLLCRAGGAISF
jgi:hypothetical protein